MKGHTCEHGVGDICLKCGKIHINGHRNKKNTDKTKQKISQKVRYNYQNNLVNKINFGLPGHTKDCGHGIPCKLCGKIHIYKRGGLIGHNYEHGTGDVCKKCEQVHFNPFIGKKHTEEWKQKSSKKSLNLWHTKRENMLDAFYTSNKRKPNKFEKNFLNYCLSIGLTNISYVGNGKFWIAVPQELREKNRAINPDFILTPFSKTKTVIETMGLYWHSPENICKREAVYQKAGINCITITDEEFYNCPELVNQKLEQLKVGCK